MATDRSRTVSAPLTRLVVLPFSNLSEDSSQEYFADGLTEELIAQLGPLCRGKVGVIARWSSMVFKGSLQRAREIGEALRADHLLEGSVRRDGPRVRIIARLIETAGESELWSKTYERTADDWLAVQADVASLVARSLIQELVPGVHTGRRADEHPAAYQAYLRGRYHWAKPGDSGLVESLVGFEEATRLAPDFAAAHGGLARVRLGSAEYYHEPPRPALLAARASASRALELDPSVSEAVAVLADTRRMLEMDWSAAEAGYLKALALNPSNEFALRAYGVTLAVSSRFEDAARYVDQACEMDPLCLMANTMAAWIRYLSGDVDRAIERCHHALNLFPEFAPARRLLGAAYLRAGECARARATLEPTAPSGSADPIRLAWQAHVAGSRWRAVRCARDDRAARCRCSRAATCRHFTWRSRMPVSTTTIARLRRWNRRGSIAIRRSRRDRGTATRRRCGADRAIWRSAWPAQPRSTVHGPPVMP